MGGREGGERGTTGPKPKATHLDIFGPGGEIHGISQLRHFRAGVETMESFKEFSPAAKESAALCLLGLGPSRGNGGTFLQSSW